MRRLTTLLIPALASSIVLVAASSHGQSLPPPPPAPPGATLPLTGTEPPPPLPAPVPTSPPALPPQSYAPPLPVYQGVPVDLGSDVAGLGFEIYVDKSRPGKDKPFLMCQGPCRVTLPPGHYHFRVTETEETLAGSRKLEITDASSIRFEPDTKAKRTTGLILGLGGPVLMIAGFATIMGSSCQECTGSDRRNDGGTAAGVVMLLGGLALTPVGWVMYGTSFKPEYDVKPLTPSVARKQSPWQFGVSPTLGGAAFAGQLRF